MFRQHHNEQMVQHNAVVDIAHATMALQKALEWSAILRLDEQLRSRWSAVLAGLPRFAPASDNTSLAHGPAGVAMPGGGAGRPAWAESWTAPRGTTAGDLAKMAPAPFAANYMYPIVTHSPIHPCSLVGLHSNTIAPERHRELLAEAVNTVWGNNERSAWHPTNGFCLAWPAATRVTNGSAPGHGTALMDRYEAALQTTMQPNFWPNMNGGGLEQVGATVAIDELLLQSHEGFIVLFPAWERGKGAASFSTLRTRGAFLVSAYLCSFPHCQAASIV